MENMFNLTLFLLSISCIVSGVAAQSQLISCLHNTGIPLLLPSDSNFIAAAQPYNERMHPASPFAIVTPRTENEVSAALKCAYVNDIKVSARSGGHSFGAYGVSGGLVVDLSGFQQIEVDDKNVASVGAGVRLGNMALGIYKARNRALPHGTCPGVGLGGHATLGGFGLTSRLWGLTLDSIMSMRVVLIDGTIVTASSTSNPDLYWALRGAGPSFGVVTKFIFRTFPAPTSNVAFTYTYNFPDPEKGAAALKIVFEWAEGNNGAPKEMGIGVLLVPGGDFILRGVFYDDQSKFTPIIAPLLNMLKTVHATSPQEVVTNQNWIDSLEALGGVTTLVEPTTGYNEHVTLYSKSLVTPPKSPPSISALKNLLTYLKPSAPSGYDPIIIINLYGGPNSAIRSPPWASIRSQTSSYSHRDAGWVWQFTAGSSGQVDRKEGLVGYVDGLLASMGNEVKSWGAYAPYVDPELDANTAREKYWGAQLGRLTGVKMKYDKKGLLGGPQGVSV